MRRLLLIRGPQGAGKSTTLQRLGLGPYTLSMDQLRLAFSGPELDREGQWTISQAQNQEISQLFMRLIEARMGRGELLAIDYTGVDREGLERLAALGQQERYQVRLLDFSTVPLEQCLRQNQQRDPMMRVPEHAIRRVHQSLRQQAPFTACPVIPWSEDGAHLSAVQAFLEVPMQEVSGYREVVFIGDLQGCLSPLLDPKGPLPQGFLDDTLYVFVGDFVDRGPENGTLVRWLLEQAVNRDNVLMMWGNHEDHLHRFARGQKPVSEEFRTRTLPQLLQAGITRAEVDHLMQRVQEVALLHYQGQRVFVSHAGLSTLPAFLAGVSGDQLSHGTGEYSDPIDDQFARHAPAGWVQVHGHRNHQHQPVLANAQAVNLEDGVEFGGSLRWAVLNASGWHGYAVRNRHFLSFRERRMSIMDKEAAPGWMHRPDETVMDPELLARMCAHEGITVRSSEAYPDIISLNFARDVFFNASWDELLVKARGLFVHRPTGTIVARGYDKFFNINERPDTTMEALEHSLQFPIALHVKENGFLGLMGIEPVSHDLFMTSKGTPDSPFAGWMRTIVQDTLSEGQREALRQYCINYDACLAFEVIDPVNDPHMIDYDAPKLVLLDVFHRAADTEKLDHDALKAFGRKFGLEVKERGMVFQNWAGFAGWYRAATHDLAYRFKGQDIEGFVVEDAAGFHTKVKLPHYAFWKTMRSTVQKIAKRQLLIEEAQTRRDGGGHIVKPHQASIDAMVLRDGHPLAQAFLGWARTLPGATLKTESLLALRAQFRATPAYDPAHLTVDWSHFDPNVDGDRPSGPSASAEPPARRRPKL